jgi:hypothetical protein
MNTEVKNDDLQSLAKEHVRLMKWLIRIVAFQGIFVVTVLSIVLWTFLSPLLVGPRYY